MNTVEEINKQIETLEKEKDSRFIQLPFEIEIQILSGKKMINSEKTNIINNSELRRILYGFKALKKNPQYKFEDEKCAENIVAVKTSIGEWFERKSFVVFISYNEYKQILEMLPEIDKKIDDMREKIKDLQRNLSEFEESQKDI